MVVGYSSCKIMELKNMILAAVAVALTFAGLSGCKKDSQKESVSITGSWHLVEIGPVSRSSDPDGMAVYISFGKDGCFDLYQQLQDGPYVHYSGHWELNASVLYGYYDDGTPLGGDSYEVSASSSEMRLKANNGSGEVTVYEKAEIPDEVRSSAREHSESNASSVVR